MFQGFRPWLTAVSAAATAVLGVGGVGAGVASSAPTLVGAPAIFVHPAGPLSVGPMRYSTNWSGYASVPPTTGGTFTAVRGSWTLPTVTCAGIPPEGVSQWVGLDGVSDQTVEQEGTFINCNGTTPVYYLWTEQYPAAAVYYQGGGPGDHITASTVYSASTHKFTLVVHDVTRGVTHSSSATCTASGGCARSSAEWIVETPTYLVGTTGRVANLPKFSTTTLSGDTATVSGSTAKESISALPSFPITMMNGTETVKRAVPSALSSSGTSFHDVWKSELY